MWDTGSFSVFDYELTAVIAIIVKLFFNSLQQQFQSPLMFLYLSLLKAKGINIPELEILP